MSEPKRIEVRFEGRVQGVGFRYTTSRIADPLAVTGYVRNLPDGAVELVAEGAESEIDKLIAAISDHFQDNLTGERSHWLAATGQFSSFAIRH